MSTLSPGTLTVSALWGTDGDVHEMRALNVDNRKGITSGYFDTPDMLQAAATTLVPRTGQIYWTVNPVKPDLLARSHNQVQPYASATTSDEHIARRAWLPLDIDPVRVAGIPSTETELHEARALATTVRDTMAARGWPLPAAMDSGNGAYLLYAIDLPNDADSTDLVQRALQAFGREFDTAAAHVDQTCYNAARILRVPGTMNRKGTGSPDRPHRLAALYSAPTGVVTPAMLTAFAGPPPAPVAPVVSRPRTGGAPDFDVAAFIGRHFPGATHKTVAGNDVWVLDVCPWNAEHNRGEAHVTRRPSGMLGAECKHESCRWTWQDLRERLEPRPVRMAAPATPALPGTQLPPPDAPLRVARTLAKRYPRTDGVMHRAFWRDDAYEWTGAHWSVLPPSTVRTEVYRATEHATWTTTDGKGEPVVKPWNPNRAKVADVVDAMNSAVIARADNTEPETGIACQNYVVDLDGDTTEHHPGRFNLSSLPFDYDADAECPQWLAFLESALPGDTAAQQFLAEWFGYVLSGRTDLQKIANLVGPPRCGKGTIGRVLGQLLGPSAVVGGDVSTIAGQFDRASMIGASLVLMGDVRWNTPDVGKAVPVLLKISGEDWQTIPRKNRDDWHGKLGVRFMMMGNDVPHFNDTSSALAGRLVNVVFRESFAGREDHGLDAALAGELAGILNWALSGLRALTARGRFVAPESARGMADDIARDASPVAAFFADRCVLEDGATAQLDALYRAFGDWCRDEGRDHVMTRARFGSHVQSAFPKLASTRVRAGSSDNKVRVYSGVRLRTASS